MAQGPSESSRRHFPSENHASAGLASQTVLARVLHAASCQVGFSQLHCAWPSEPVQIWHYLLAETRKPLLLCLEGEGRGRAAFLDWLLNHAFLFVPAQAIVGQFISWFQEFPPSQKAGSFSLDQVMDKLTQGATGND